MEGFAIYGYGSVVAAIACGALVFFAAKKIMALPWFLNLPGALIVVLGAFLAGGWLFTVTGVTTREMPGFPGVPWTNGAGVLVLAVCWYQAVWMIFKWLRKERIQTH